MNVCKQCTPEILEELPSGELIESKLTGVTFSTRKCDVKSLQQLLTGLVLSGWKEKNCYKLQGTYNFYCDPMFYG